MPDFPPQGRPIDIISLDPIVGATISESFVAFATEDDEEVRRVLLSEVSAAAATQNIFQKVVGNTGSIIVADTPTDTLAITGQDLGIEGKIETETDEVTDTLQIRVIPSFARNFMFMGS